MRLDMARTARSAPEGGTESGRPKQICCGAIVNYPSDYYLHSIYQIIFLPNKQRRRNKACVEGEKIHEGKAEEGKLRVPSLLRCMFLCAFVAYLWFIHIRSFLVKFVFLRQEISDSLREIGK